MEAALQAAIAKNSVGDPLQVGGAVNKGDLTMAGMNGEKMEGMDMGGGSNSPKGAVDLQQFVGKDTCWPMDIIELQVAVEKSDCPLVVLSNPDPEAYMLMDMNEIMVMRHVRVMGHPAFLPTIDAMMGMRAFTVMEGGFLELQYVRIRQSMGMYRDRYGLEGREDVKSKVLEVKGGGVLLEEGAEGANFVGVIFLAVMTDQAMTERAFQDQLDMTGWRVYGGHVYVTGGTVRFFNCHFWDSMILMPFTDQVMIGADVLVVAGSVFLTGCTFTNTMFFCNYGGAGWHVATLGGTTVLTWCTIQWQSIAMSMYVAGMVIFTGGGVTILTGVDFRFVSVVMNFMGFGSFATGAGVLVATGVTQEQAYAAFSAFGVGMYNAVGAGVLVESGATFVQFSGPGYMAMTGAVEFVGTGASSHVGVPASMYGSTVAVHGQGGFSYNGAGSSVWVGCPMAMFWAVYSFLGLGGMVSQGAGIVVWVGNPIFMPVAVSYFAGLGMVMFVGGGSAVIALSPVYMPTALMAFSSPTMTMMTDDVMMPNSTFMGGHHGGGGGPMNDDSTGMDDDMGMMMMHMPHAANFWIQGNTEATGKGSAFVTGGGMVEGNIKWASHMLDSDPEFNLYEGVPNNMTMSSRDRVRGLRKRRLSGAAFNDALSLFDDGADGGASKLLAIGLNVDNLLDVRATGMAKKFKSWVPDKLMDAAADIAALRESPAFLEATKDTELNNHLNEDPVTLQINTEHLDYCGVCETELVGGKGLNTCEVEDSCAVLQAGAPAGAQAAFDFGEVAFDPTHIVVAEFLPTTGAEVEEGGLDPEGLRRALQGYFKVNGTSGIHVSTFSGMSDEFFTGLADATAPATRARRRALRRLRQNGEEGGVEGTDMEDEDEEEQTRQRKKLRRRISTLANAEYPNTHALKAVFVTADTAKAQALATALSDKSSEGYQDMDLYVSDYLNAREGVLIQALDGAVLQQFNLPAYASLDFTKAFADEVGSAAGAQSVRLVDPANLGMPLSRAVVGKEYNVELAGFPQEILLSVSLFGRDATGDKQTAAVVKRVVTTDKKGGAAFAWTVPRGQAKGEYYLKASDMTGKVFGLSTIFEVDQQARRRLVGPWHTVDF